MKINTELPSSEESIETGSLDRAPARIIRSGLFIDSIEPLLLMLVTLVAPTLRAVRQGGGNGFRSPKDSVPFLEGTDEKRPLPTTSVGRGADLGMASPLRRGAVG